MTWLELPAIGLFRCPRRLRLPGGVALVLLAVGACGDDGSSSGSGPSATSGTDQGGAASGQSAGTGPGGGGRAAVLRRARRRSAKIALDEFLAAHELRRENEFSGVGRFFDDKGKQLSSDPADR